MAPPPCLPLSQNIEHSRSKISARRASPSRPSSKDGTIFGITGSIICGDASCTRRISCEGLPARSESAGVCPSNTCRTNFCTAGCKAALDWSRDLANDDESVSLCFATAPEPATPPLPGPAPDVPNITDGARCPRTTSNND